MSAVETRLPLRAAMEAGDLRAAVASFADDAVFRSPFTDNLTFEGHAQLEGLIAAVLEVFNDLTYTDELHGDGTAVLLGHARVNGMRVQLTDYLKLRDDGMIEEMTVFLRPLPASTATMRSLGARLGAQKSRLRGRAISAMAAPLALMTRSGDRVAVRMLKP